MPFLALPALFAAIVVLALCAPAAAEEIFRLDDPRGDDSGAGDLVYPNLDYFLPGTLDLEYLSANAARDGTWFKARMSRPIVSPAGRVTVIGGEPLEKIARNGFHTFNIDIYIDTDRVGWSGRTDTLPGRHADIHPDFAWEKAVILTPRPQVARAWYALHLGEARENELRAAHGRVDRDDRASIEADVDALIASRVFFPDRVRVRGREVEFFVPADFLGGTAQADWGYTAFVTAAEVEQAGKVLNVFSGTFNLMVLQTAVGRSPDRVGILRQGDPNQPPVIDVLAPTVDAQVQALSDYDVVAPRLAALRGISPAGREAVAGAPPPSVETPGVSATGASAAPGAVPTPAAPPGEARRTIPSRLRTLNDLREVGLISEEEYQQLRRKILSEI